MFIVVRRGSLFCNFAPFSMTVALRAFDLMISTPVIICSWMCLAFQFKSLNSLDSIKHRPPEEKSFTSVIMQPSFSSSLITDSISHLIIALSFGSVELWKLFQLTNYAEPTELNPFDGVGVKELHKHKSQLYEFPFASILDYGGEILS